jgi:hypothetical protein
MRRIVAFVAAVLGLASTARADIIIYEQLPGPNSIGFNSAQFNAGGQPPGFTVADNFLLPFNATITGLHWWGVLPGGGVDFRFTFYADNGGVPGKILLMTGGPTPSEKIDGAVGPLPRIYYETNFDTPFVATVGTTYWLSVWNQMPGATWGWVSSNTTGDGARGGMNPGPPWDVPRPDMAFQLTTVPAPPAVVLVGLGAGCVALRRYVGRWATA